MAAAALLQPAHCSFACLINFPCSRAHTHTGQCVWFMTDKTAALATETAAALSIFWSSVQLPPPPHLYRHRPSSFSSVHFEAHTDALAHKIWYSYKLFHTVFWGRFAEGEEKEVFFLLKKQSFLNWNECLSAYSSNSSCMPLYNPPVLVCRDYQHWPNQQQHLILCTSFFRLPLVACLLARVHQHRDLHLLTE